MGRLPTAAGPWQPRSLDRMVSMILSQSRSPEGLSVLVSVPQPAGQVDRAYRSQDG